MAEAKRDQNYIPTLLGVSSVDGKTPVVLYADPVTHRLYVDMPTGTGDVTGPASAVDGNFASFDGTTGKIIKDSGKKIADFMVANGAIVGATKTKITYDAKGLVTAGADATTADIADSANKRYITDAQQSALHGVNDANTTSNSYADGKVEDSIVDGHTTVAPSGNAVFDALAAKVPTTRTLTINGTALDLSADRSWTISSGALWTLMPGTPTRVGNTSFTVTGDVTAYVAKGMIVKWTESSAVKCAMVSIPSTYGAPNTTITIIGDTMASIDASSLKYCMLGAENFYERFSVAGTLGATGTDIANAFYGHEPMRLLGADLQVGTAGTTNSTTIDININGTTAFTTKPTLATTVAASPTPFTADNGKSIALNDRISIDIDAVQTTAAIDLYVKMYVLPTRYLSLS